MLVVAPIAGGLPHELVAAGFVLALLGLLTSWIPFLNIVGISLSVIGVILASLGLAKSTQVNAGRALAIGGLVLGPLAVISAVLTNVVFVSVLALAVKETTKTSVEAPAGGEAASGADLGTARDNPAPPGSAIGGREWTVQIISVKTISKDSLGETPTVGTVLLSIHLSATYTGDDPQGSTPSATVAFVRTDGTSIDSDDGDTEFVAEHGFDSSKTVYTGVTLTGDTLIAVPAGNWQDGVLAVAPSLLSDDVFVAVQ